MRILLADDHDLVRAGLRGILERIAGVEVVGEARTGREATQLARELCPEIVLMDVSMPDLNGIVAARQILAENCETKIIVISMHADPRFVNDVLQAGARGYLLKNRAAVELAPAIEAVTEGKIFLSPDITGLIVERYLRNELTVAASPLSTLSSREREVLQLLAEGKTSKEIATTLHVSVKTVEAQRGQIMQKLQLRTVAELTKFAIREGLTSLE